MTVAQRTSAARMIAAKGQAVTIRGKSIDGYNAATGSIAVRRVTQTGKGVILPLRQGFQAVNGSPAGDKTCILTALDDNGAALVPVVNDTLTDASGTDYTVTHVATTAPAGLAIMHELVLRGHE